MSMVSARLMHKQNTSKHCDGKDNNNNINIVWSETLPLKTYRSWILRTRLKIGPEGRFFKFKIFEKKHVKSAWIENSDLDFPWERTEFILFAVLKHSIQIPIAAFHHLTWTIFFVLGGFVICICDVVTTTAICLYRGVWIDPVIGSMLARPHNSQCWTLVQFLLI